MVGTKAIGSDVAKKLYSQLGLRFVEHSNYALNDYIEQSLNRFQNHEWSEFTVSVFGTHSYDGRFVFWHRNLRIMGFTHWFSVSENSGFVRRLDFA